MRKNNKIHCLTFIQGLKAIRLKPLIHNANSDFEFATKHLFLIVI